MPCLLSVTLRLWSRLREVSADVGDVQTASRQHLGAVWPHDYRRTLHWERLCSRHPLSRHTPTHPTLNMAVRTRVVGVAVLPMLSDQRGMTNSSTQGLAEYRRRVEKAIKTLLRRNPIDDEGTREGNAPGYDEVRTPHPSPAHQHSTHPARAQTRLRCNRLRGARGAVQDG